MKMDNGQMKSFIKQQSDVLDEMERIADEAVEAGFDEDAAEPLLEHVAEMRQALKVMNKMLKAIEDAVKKKKAEDDSADDDDDLSFLD